MAAIQGPYEKDGHKNWEEKRRGQRKYREKNIHKNWEEKRRGQKKNREKDSHKNWEEKRRGQKKNRENTKRCVTNSEEPRSHRKKKELEIEGEKLEKIKYKGAAVRSRAREGETEILLKQILVREQNEQKKRGMRKLRKTDETTTTRRNKRGILQLLHEIVKKKKLK